VIGATGLLNGRKVLVVEDQYYLATEMKRLVGNLGGSIIGPARSVESAEALLAQEVDPDLAILDINLDGLRVYPLAESLRERGVPFVFVSGYEPWAIDPEFAATPVVGKPVTVTGLAAALGKLIDAETGEPGP
jgi:two-component SAPR family response regulator